MTQEIPPEYIDNEVPDDEVVTNQLEMTQWQIDPVARKKWGDINKDNSLGNLSEGEMIRILAGEDHISSILSLRSQMPTKQVAEYFFPTTIIDAVYRKKASVLALSNSKKGFLRQLMHTQIIKKNLGYNPFTDEGEPQEEQKPQLNFFQKMFKKKKKPQGLL